MKSAVALLGAMATVATAYSPAKHLHFPRANSTTTAAPASGMTTLTVKTTQTKTVISCAPTVTNCPADEKGMSTVPESDRTTNVVTNTVVLTETVCPVSDVEKVVSQVHSQHDAKPTQTPVNGMTTKVVDVVQDKTITITMGVGKSQSVVPTVIKSTIQSTVTVPCETGAEGSEPTTTTTATSTSTRTVTVERPKSTQTVPAGGNESGSKGEQNCKEAPAVTVTVAQTTITAPASTVYVTVPCDDSKTGSGEAPAVTGKAGGNDNVDKGEDSKPAQTEDCPPDETTTIQATVTVVPYPTGGNNSTSGAAGPSGFARLRR